ncbi:hypothetical protein QBC43DRAFT_53434 [Cladorrhinum sp. PSN259]|nr:hypothetical protein QBC43DRAFT_53434 [Cladorrhinum sp. PSN259]
MVFWLPVGLFGVGCLDHGAQCLARYHFHMTRNSHLQNPSRSQPPSFFFNFCLLKGNAAIRSKARRTQSAVFRRPNKL